MMQLISKLTGVPVKRSFSAGMLLFALIALPAQQSDAQVVPYRVEGTGFGSLMDLSSFGEAKGLHLGHFSYVGNNMGVTTQFLRDGSTLQQQRVQILFLDTTDPDPETGLVVTTLIEEIAILGGTGRFSNAQPAGDNITTFVESEPYDPNGDLTAIPFRFESVGQMDLGRRRRR